MELCNNMFSNHQRSWDSISTISVVSTCMAIISTLISINTSSWISSCINTLKLLIRYASLGVTFLVYGENGFRMCCAIFFAFLKCDRFGSRILKKHRSYRILWSFITMIIFINMFFPDFKFFVVKNENKSNKVMRRKLSVLDNLLKIN